MNSKLLIIALVVVFGGGGFVLWQLFSTDVPEAATDSTVTETVRTTTSGDAPTTEPLSGTGSLEALVARGENLECSIRYNPAQAAVAVEGTYFVSRERMRGDFVSTTAEGDEYVASMIKTGDMLYTWSEIDGGTYGMQINLAELPESSDETQPDTREPVPLDANVTYDCKPWPNVDGAIFEPPSDVVFTDYGAVMEGGMEFGTVYDDPAAADGDPCASCERLPAAAAAECRAALQCGASE